MPQAYVASTGKREAQIVIIGEAPGRDELLAQKAFVGSSGKLLDALLTQAGWSRQETYCTNVIKIACPRSPLQVLPASELERWQGILQKELEQTKANVYIPLGATALWAMTGETSITNWRGSLMQDPTGRKIIPTFHPAYLLRTPEDTFKVQRDLQFAVRESSYSEVNLPLEQYYTYPSLREALDFLSCASQAKYIAFDIETNGSALMCYSVAFENAQGTKQVMSIPHIGSGYWKGLDYMKIFYATQALLAQPEVTKIGQNVSYDIIGLKAFGAETKMPFEDIMHMWHAIDPRAPKGLAFQASMHLRRTFWKDWEQAPDISNVDNLYEYNCKDSDITYDLRKIYYFKYPQAMQFYEKHYKPVLPKLIQMYTEGICQDQALQLELAKDYREQAENINNAIINHFNVPKFNVNSSLQLKKLLYEELKLPIQYRLENRKRVITANDKALLDLFLDTQDQFVLAIRNAKQFLKFASFLNPSGKNAKLKRKTSDGRLRCEYKMTTGTGRLSSSASLATKLGINLQNIPKDVRRTYIPSPGYIFLERDYRQAEAYVIAWDTPDVDLMHRFSEAMTEPKKFDFHWHNTEIMMQRPRSECTARDRQVNKSVAYGSYYAMTPRRVQQTILEQSEPQPIFIPLDDCRQRQELFINATQCDKRQARIRNELLETGQQRSPTGQIVTYHEIITGSLKYRFGKRDYSEIFRSAYSMIPQDVVARLTNAALVEIDNELRSANLGRVVLQVHDALLLEVLDNADALAQAWNISSLAMAGTFNMRGGILQIPADGKIGYHWKLQREDIYDVDMLLEAYQEIRKAQQ